MRKTSKPVAAGTIRKRRSSPSAKTSSRTLSDFGQLRPSEVQLVESYRRRLSVRVGDGLPESGTEENSIRAEFLRFLALGGEDRSTADECLIDIAGAFIEGSLDLSYRKVMSQVILRNCRFESKLNLVGSSITILSLSGSAVPSLFGDYLTSSGSLLLDQGFQANGEVSLVGAQIGGQFSCIGGTFANPGGRALTCDRLKAASSVFLRGGFNAIGMVRLLGARIVGNLDCSDGSFENRGGIALALDGGDVTGSVILDKNFKSVGEVRLSGSTIRGQITCKGGKFIHPKGTAFNCESTKVGASIVIEGARFRGVMNFISCSAALLDDSEKSWSAKPRLDGFRYERIGGPTDASMRIRWLRKQGVDVATFRPDPWEHLVKVLREMGHAEDAKRVAIAKQQTLRQAGLIGQRPVAGQGRRQRLVNQVLNAIHRGFHDIYGLLAGFGYRPLKTVAWMGLVWFICGLAYYAAAADGLIGPTNSGVYANARFDRCGDAGQRGREHWTECTAMPSEYSPFDPFVFSLDVILPLLDLKQETEWRPIVHSAGGRELTFGHALRFLMWFEIFFGWVTSLLLVSVVGRLVQKD